jgi:chromosome segregation ATPase
MSGGGSYKLKNETGKVVADKRVKEELDRILSCYNIQVDNPIALLNQDTAKTLLFKCHPDKLYLFFMRATQLDDCHQYYNEAAIDKNKADYTLERKVKQAYEMKAEKVEWEKKYQFYQKLEEKKERLNDVKKELAYATLDTLNEEVDDKKGKVGLASNKISSCQEKIDQEIDDKNALKHQKDAVEAEIQSITEVAVAYENDLNELRLNARNVRSEAKKLDSEEGKL